ncbi:MAG: putative selenate reductase subunit YgfK [Bacteroidales bacterium]|nr:putative selenate reductase subunit YgfK [Bacteroidales bacterium]
MSDKFSVIPIDRLLSIILNEEKNKHTIFGIDTDLFFVPEDYNIFQLDRFGIKIDTPVGVAAGPHSQMAQNIIMAYLCGARYIELKTVQTLDELEVPKPCIDMQDEGYNCEWSQELKIKETFNEYLNAWIIIHILNDKFGLKKDIGTIFNMSVGYNMEGILKENVQWFFDKMNNCKLEKYEKINLLKTIYPKIVDIDIPDKISDNITLSTMHGCPANEIEEIGRYLIENKKLHTVIKLNPTLIGAEKLRDILNNKLKFNTIVPDIAFEHDLKYPDAIKMIKSLQKAALQNNVTFGLKLTNTLECINNKDVFDKDAEMMYMSGRPLHPISINLAKKIQNDFDGKLDISFSAGADAFNISQIISCGLKPVTVSTDLLKPGGYARILQYLDELKKSFINERAANIEQFILFKNKSKDVDIEGSALDNLKKYADEVLENDAYKKTDILEPDIKTNRELEYFDCIKASCTETCPTNQDIPDYMYYTAKGEFDKAFEIIMRTNPFPNTTGMVCDHTCQNKCTRINYDKSLYIREIKRFVSENGFKNFDIKPLQKNGLKVGIIGAGPSGLSAAYFLTLASFEVNVYETGASPGGMVSRAIPSFRLTNETFQKDIDRIIKLGVKIYYNSKIDEEEFSKLKNNNDYVYIATGAQLSTDINIEGVKDDGVIDSLDFLFKVKENKNTGIGKNIAVIGGGNTAMDSARTAYRMVGKNGKVTIIYRRTIKEMPADQGEIKAVIDEGIEILELTTPKKIKVNKDKVSGIVCYKMKLGDKDESGRARPVIIENSEFELDFDTIIPAIGQKLDIDFIDNKLLEANTKTYQTKVENIFIGGDALRGASTAINAIGDGRKAAENIIKKAQKEHNINNKLNKNITFKELKSKRYRRELPVKIKETSLDDRKNFNLVTSTLNKDEAVKEASRCLYCDELCNICVTVCPNMANYSYQTEPKVFNLQKAVLKNDKIVFEDDQIFSIDQKYQILNITDFCNECGNCNTFCPTKGAPYKDKPKFYLTTESFNKTDTGYFISKLKDKTNLIFKTNKDFKVLSLINNEYIYDTDFVNARFNQKDFKLIDVKFKTPCTKEAYFKIAAEMSILLAGAMDLY